MKSQTSEKLAKEPSYITGLDEVLRGGLPKGRTTLVEGGPGSGKSILALEFLYRGALAGQPGIFIAFEERASAVRQNARTLGWDLEALEKDNRLRLIEASLDPGTVVTGDFNIKGLLAIIEGQSKAMGTKRIVFDALDMLVRLYNDQSRERGEMYALHQWLLDHEMTAILTVKAPEGAFSRYEFMEYMADCVIRLTQRPGEWLSTREIQIVKYRGSDFGRNAYPFVIQPGGLFVMPITEFSLQHRPLGPHISSGNRDLDRALGGGYRKGSSILLAGASGTGKTTIANTFVKAACERGQKTVYVGFEESEGAMVASMLSPGIDLQPDIDSGCLTIITAMPEAKGTEQHLANTFQAIDRIKPEHIVVDATSSFERMGTSRAAFEFAMRLVNYCKDRGITCFLINQSGGGDERQAISGLGIPSIMDCILWLRFVETGNKVKRMLLVVKSRGSSHSNQYHEYRITSHGIEIRKAITAGPVTTEAKQ